jgi:5-methyltetrahydropteroyltriglutamate--homocysteine methyltransferase
VIPLLAPINRSSSAIDTLTNFAKHPEVISDHLERTAKMVGDPTRILAGTDCEFDTSAGMGRVTADIVWAKQRALKESAELAGSRLF